MPSKSQQNRKLAERFYSATVEEGPDIADEVLVEEFVMHDPTLPGGEIRGRERIKEYYQTVRNSFSNPRNEIEDIIATDDSVTVRYTMRGTHDREEFMGVEPTGEEFSISGIDILHVEDGRFVEGWSEMNVYGLMSQLGAIPEAQVELTTD
jgi:predicted ester cyclase